MNGTMTDMKEMTLRDIQAISLEIMKAVHAFCVENGIKYSLAYGTLIGAVRHQGFIPWDDDLDIVMPRPDYNKFCRTFKKDGLQVISRENRKDCLISFARVCDTRKTRIRTMLPWIRKQGDLGVWIDVFPIDSAPDNKDEFHNLYVMAERTFQKSIGKRKAFRAINRDYSFGYNFNTLKKKLFSLFSHSPEYHLDVLENIIEKTPYGSTDHLTQLAYPAKEEYMDAHVLDGFHTVPFEDGHFYVMDGYDQVLRMEYGDYMELPPTEQRTPQQHYIRFMWKEGFEN